MALQQRAPVLRVLKSKDANVLKILRSMKREEVEKQVSNIFSSILIVLLMSHSFSNIDLKELITHHVITVEQQKI